MRFHLSGVRIAAISAAQPRQRIELSALAEPGGEMEFARIARNTGIHAIRVAPEGMLASDLCAAAAQALFVATDLPPGSIDAAVFVSQTPDRVMPATSATLQSRLGLPSQAAVFDLSGGCAGYIYGLLQSALLIGGGCKRVLLCTGDTVTRFLHPSDRHVRMLFGDAGSATLLERGDGESTLAVHTDGGGATTLIVPRHDETALAERLGGRPGYLHMDGGEVMNFALRVVPSVIAEVCDAQGWLARDVGLFALHQANAFILRHVQRKLAVPEDSVPCAVDDAGNTGPASIPLLLARVGARYPAQRRRNTVLCGFGVGLSWGAATFDLSATQFVEPVLV